MEFQIVQGIENPLEGNSGPTHHRRLVVLSSVQPSHVLLFEAMTARFDIRCHDLNHDMNQAVYQVSLYIPSNNRVVGTVRLETGWGQILEFVAIAQETREVEVFSWNDPRPSELKEVIHTLIVETDVEGIWERKHIFTLDKVDWDEVKPKRQTILLV